MADDDDRYEDSSAGCCKRSPCGRTFLFFFFCVAFVCLIYVVVCSQRTRLCCFEYAHEYTKVLGSASNEAASLLYCSSPVIRRRNLLWFNVRLALVKSLSVPRTSSFRPPPMAKRSVFLFFLLLLISLRIPGVNGAVGGAHYSWKASVDRSTAKAYSLETSFVPPKSKLAKAVAHHDDLLGLACPMFDKYPVWLCRFPTTLGFLKAVPSKGGGHHIKTRIFGITLLSLGVPFAHSLRLKSGESETTVVLPITGGILSLSGAEGKDRGALKFAIQSVSSAEQEGVLKTKIVTAISGYRPTLCGKQTPTSFLRTKFYLSSQSVLHSYVMWRFHRHCQGLEFDLYFDK